MAPKIKLTYFDIEAAAEPTRLALALSGTEYDDERIKFPEWAALKPTTPYGQLPLMVIDDGPVKTQSGAMLRWVGSECSTTLYPRDKLYDIEEIMGLLDDAKRDWSAPFGIGMSPQKLGHPEGYNKTDEGKALTKKMREDFVKDSLPVHLDRLTKLLEKNGEKWLVPGDDPTIADCAFVSFLRAFTRGHIDFIDTTCLETHPKVVAYCKRFLDLPPINGRYTNGIGTPSY